MVKRTKRFVGEVWNGTVVLLGTPVKLGWAILGYLTFVAGLGLIVDRIFDIRADQQAVEINDQNERIYESDLRTWQQELSDYNTCLGRVQAREDTREQWNSFYDALIEEFGSESPRFVHVINDVLRPKIAPSLSASDCVKPGPPPSVPARVEPGDPFPDPGPSPTTSIVNEDD